MPRKRKVYAENELANRLLKDSIDPLSKEEEQAAFAAYRAGDISQRDRIIRANIRYAFSVAAEYEKRSVDHLEELFQEGCTGLVEAFERYEEARGLKFISYATWWIRRRIRESLPQKTVHLPVHRWYVFLKFSRVRRELEATSEGPVSWGTINRIAGTDLSPNEELSFCSLDNPLRMMDNSSDDSNDLDLLDFFLTVQCRAVEPDALETMEITERAEEVRKWIGTLNDRLRSVIEWRYGMGDGFPKTLQQIGDQLGVTKERARQLVNEAHQLILEVRKNTTPAEVGYDGQAI